jgi:hypothetical protein
MWVRWDFTKYRVLKVCFARNTLMDGRELIDLGYYGENHHLIPLISSMIKSNGVFL